MTRFAAETLDLSRLPPADLVQPIDYEAIVAARIADLKERFDAADIPFDVEALETDPAVMLQQADAYREFLGLQAINDAGRAVMLAFATGADLDNLAAVYAGGITRLLVSAGPPAVYESDDRFRRRILLAPEAYVTAGSAGGYAYHALTAEPTLADVSVQNPAPGAVVVTVMGSNTDPEPTEEQVESVRTHLFREDVKPITDVLSVLGADVIETDVVAQLVLYPGPDSAAVVNDARTALEAFLRLNKRLGRDLRRSAIAGRLHRDSVHSVNLTAPVSDLIATPGQVVWVRSITLTVTGRDE